MGVNVLARKTDHYSAYKAQPRYEMTSMDDKDKTDITSPDEPLFVLRYQRSRVVSRIWLVSLLAILLPGTFLVLLTTLSGFRLLLGLLVFGSLLSVAIWSLFDLLSFKEIRLYEDRIVQVSGWAGEKEISLVNSKLAIRGGGLGLRIFTSANVVGIWNRNADIWFTRPVVAWDEALADRKDVKKLRSLLAHLSGRKIREFEDGMLFGDKLIKKEMPPSANVIRAHAPDEPVEHPTDGEREYDHAAWVATLVYVVFAMLGICALWFAVLSKPR